MERFFNQQNLQRYRQLANGILTVTERRAVFALLSDVETTYRDAPQRTITESAVVR